MVFSFPKVVKELIPKFSERDYRVLNTRLFISCWVGFALDQSLKTIRDLFKRPNQGGVDLDISTFSKANQHRSLKPFQELYQQVLGLVKQKKAIGKGKNCELDDYEICPIDSAIITLTSKLLWALRYHQVKLLTVLNNASRTGEHPLIHFGQEHDYKFATQMTENLAQKQVRVMNRGFTALEYLKQLQEQKKHFVIRANTNYKLEPLESGEWQEGTGKKQGIYRVVWFLALETKTEYRIFTNLPQTISNQEVAEFYRQRWQIELSLKFLKMHLKLDHLISKSPNGITI